MARKKPLTPSSDTLHMQRILRVLGQYGALSRSELAEHIGLSRTTLSEVTNALIECGAVFVVNTDADQRIGRGRPAERLALDPEAGQLMGVDFGHGRVHVSVVDASHNVIASGGIRYSATSTWVQRIDFALALIDRLGEETGAHFGALQGIGIGFPGPLSQRMAGGSGDSAAGLHRTAGELVCAAFADRFDAPVIIDNNSRFAALAEASWDSSLDTEHLLYLRLSDGIGGGLVVGGRLLSGSSGFAGELGHVSVDVGGLPCHCGKRGCLETVASVPAILARCQADGAAVTTLEKLRTAVGQGDPIVDNVLRNAGRAVGRVLGPAAVALNPSEIVVGGELVDAAPVVLEQAAGIINYELLPMLETAPRIRTARLGDEAGSLGAIVAMFHQSPLLASYPKPSTRNPSVPARREVS